MNLGNIQVLGIYTLGMSTGYFICIFSIYLGRLFRKLNNEKRRLSPNNLFKEEAKELKIGK